MQKIMIKLFMHKVLNLRNMTSNFNHGCDQVKLYGGIIKVFFLIWCMIFLCLLWRYQFYPKYGQAKPSNAMSKWAFERSTWAQWMHEFCLDILLFIMIERYDKYPPSNVIRISITSFCLTVNQDGQILEHGPHLHVLFSLKPNSSLWK